jgi:hypothetical protein
MIKKSENKLLNELVKDCITYRLTETEALDYIKARYDNKISLASYKRRKALFRSDLSTQVWLNDFTRIGYVINHRQHMAHINQIRDDSMHQFYIEINKPNRDERKILALKDSIMESTKLLVELDLGTPIISAIKSRLEQNAEASQIRQ